MINEMLKSTFRTLGRIFAYILLAFLLYFILSCFQVKAETFVSLNNNTMSSNGYVGLPQGNRRFNIWDTQVFHLGDEPQYFRATFCTDTKQIYNWSQYTTDRFPINVYFYKTNLNCTFPNSTYTGGRVFYIYGQLRYYGTNGNNLCGTSYCTLDNDLQFYESEYASWALIDVGYSDTPFTIDYSADSIITNQNSNTTSIINSQNIINQSINNAGQKINDINSSVESLNTDIMDDDDANVSILEDIQDYMPSDTPITNLVTMPLTLFNAYINGIGGTCQTWDIPFGSFFNNYTLQLPCINLARRLGVDVWSYQGYSLWDIIDLMMCMFFIYRLALAIIGAYNSLASLDDTYALMTQQAPLRSGLHG